jgi:membrane protein required for colicin V production
MNWIDATVLVIIGLSAVFSMVRGFVREVLGVAAWVGAGIAALRLFPLVQPEVASLLPKGLQHFAVYGAMGVVFIVVLVVLSLVSALIGGLVRDSALSSLDHSLGLVFGAVRGAVIVACAYVALSIGVAPDQWPRPVVKARFLPLAYMGANELVGLLPAQYQPKVDPLPGAKAPPATQLMVQPVAGSALAATPAVQTPSQTQTP